MAGTATDETLYELMRDLGDVRIRENFYKLREAGKMSKTRMGSALVGKAAFDVLQLLHKYAKRKPTKPNARRVLQLLREIKVEPAIAVALQTMVDKVALGFTGTSPVTITGLRTMVGHALKNEMEFAHLAKLQPSRYGFARRLLNDPTISPIAKNGTKKFLLRIAADEQLEIPAWDRSDCYLIGALLVDFIMKYSGLFIQEQIWIPKNWDSRHRCMPKHVVKFTEAVQQWIEEGIDALVDLKPVNLPISTPPLDWGHNRIGGYDREERRMSGIITARSNHHQSAFDRSECPEVYSAINTIQRTSWRINKTVYKTIKVAVDHQWPDINVDLHPGDKPQPPDKEFEANDPEWRAYRRKKIEHYHLELRWRRSRLRVARAMSVAEILNDIDKFYYPHQLDFRTRCYPVGGPLQYQGPDIQRGILEFAEGKPVDTVEARQWHYIHGANCWGNDKVPFRDRVAWVQENHQRIMGVAEDPIDNRWWTEADEPVQFLAWCLDYHGIHTNIDHLSHLPVAMDGSNNGLQIYSLLLRDEVGGRATNCSPSEYPNDIYGEVAKVLTRKLESLAVFGGEAERRRAGQVLRFCKMQGFEGVPRNAVKRPVMTLPYGATIYSCQHYLCEWYHDYVRGKNLDKNEAPFPDRDSYKIFTWVGNLTWEAIGEVVIKARECMEWLREASDLLTAKGYNIEWTTPLGVRCVQRYTRGKLKRLSLKAGGMLKLQVWEDDGNPDRARSANGFCPNFIHSLDASAMMLTVNKAMHEGVTHFMMIHDSFATHAADAPTMAECLREAYVEIFTGDRLHQLKKELESQLGAELRPLPDYGNLDLEELTEADYFFA